MKKYKRFEDFINRPNKGKIRKSYYSIWIPEGDPNYAHDITVSEHENCILVDSEACLRLGNHFATKEKRIGPRKRLLKF